MQLVYMAFPPQNANPAVKYIVMHLFPTRLPDVLKVALLRNCSALDQLAFGSDTAETGIWMALVGQSPMLNQLVNKTRSIAS